jgi:CCR4-NOT transcriptional regulation complex NOT5 subunit
MLRRYATGVMLTHIRVLLHYELLQEPLSDLLTKTAALARKESTGNSQPISRKLSRQSSTASTASAASTASKAATIKKATTAATTAANGSSQRAGSSIQHSTSVEQPLIAVKSEPLSQPATAVAAPVQAVQVKKKKKSKLNSLDSDSDSD